jgi:hypothetical protein
MVYKLQDIYILYVTKIIKIIKIAINIIVIILWWLSGIPTWKLVERYLVSETTFRRNGCPKAVGKKKGEETS